MKLVRTDKLRDGDLIAGTELSGNYETGPRRLASRTRCPSEEKRANGDHAYTLVWTTGESTVYYADTMVWLAQRP